MSKILLVLKNEIIMTVGRRSFILSTIALPLLGIVAFLIASAVNSNPQSGAASAVSNIFSDQAERSNLAEGYVDPAGLIKVFPEGIPAEAYRAFPDEAAARQALERGEISAYYLISPDYIETGKLEYIRPDFNPLSAFDQAGPMRWILTVNLLGGDEELARRINQPLMPETVSLAPEQERDEDNPLTFIVPYAVTLLFYVMIMMSASFLLNSVTKEKENRIMEILMNSVTPRQLLMGKIAGLALVGLFQTMLWAVTAYSLLRLSGRAFSLPAAFQLPLSFLFWAVIFFLLGYAIYASLMASVGALVPNLREASQATFVVIIPLLIPLMMISVIIEDPHGTLATVLSLFPLTSPVVMMTRLAAGGVPFWQLLAAVALLILTSIFILRAVSNLFHAQTLLSGQPFSIGRLFRSLAGRA